MKEIIYAVRKIIPGEYKKLYQQIRKIHDLPEDNRREQLATVLHNECVKAAGSFVQQELQKKDSPFLGADKTDFFHEIVALNFWVIDKTVAGKKKVIMTKLHEQYYKSFFFKGSFEEEMQFLHDRYKVYHEYWDEVTGHQDEYAEKVAVNIFGRDKTFPVPQVCFWIISYTFEMIDKYSDIRRLCRDAKIKI